MKGTRYGGWIAGQRQAFVANLRLFSLLRAAGWVGPCFVVTSVAFAASGAAQAVAIGLVVSQVAGLRAADASVGDLLAPLALFAAILLFQDLLGAAVKPLSDTTARRVEGRVRWQVRRLLADSRGLAWLEDQGTQNDVAAVTDGAAGSSLSAALLSFTGAASAVVAVLAGGAVVARLDGRLALLYAAVLFAGRSALRRKWLEVFSAHMQQTTLFRRRAYVSTLNRDAAKESRIYGLDAFFVERHDAAHKDSFRVILTAYWSRQRVQMTWLALATATLGLIGYVAVAKALDGSISVGQATAYLLAAETMLVSLAAVASPSAQAAELFAAFDRLDAGRRAPLRQTAHATREQPSGGAGGSANGSDLLRLEGVSFRYPDSDLRVLDGLNLTIRAGESLAVVGVNGAGKTSLMKLIAGLYEPESGEILVHGRPLTAALVDGWRAELGGVFQDFVQYPLSVRNNVALGAGEELGNPDAVAAALEAAGATELVDALPDGWDTILSKQFDGGTELSGGQWQRLALARAIYAAQRGAALVLLDEPTAHLDVRAEFDAFDRLLKHTAGVASVIVSHRFSTVRKADRIVVIDQGRVVQDGTHASLVAAPGLYREMFTTQASRFMPTSAPAADPDDTNRADA